MRVLIIGAGLGGLCLAQALHKAGVDVAVFERDDSPVARLQGYRLHIDNNGREALESALPGQLYELFLATAGIPQPRTVVYDDQLTEVWSHEHPDAGHFSVNRLTLRQILLAGIEDSVSFGREFVRFEDTGTVTAYFADGSTASGDVLVAADGVNSAVRRQYLPHARIVDTGVVQVYGKIPLTAETRALLLDGMFGIFTPIVGPGGRFVGIGQVERREPVEQAVARLAPGLRLAATEDYISCSYGSRHEIFPRTYEEMSGEELRAMVLGEVAGWHPRVRQLVEAVDPRTLFPLRLRTSVPIPRWDTTRVTLLGDAIHAMSPAGGVGANTALRDARLLADHLVRGGIADYEANMTDYGFAAVRASAENGQRVLGQDPLPV